MESLVDEQNFYLGCRVCRRLLAKASSFNFFDVVSGINIQYKDAYTDCTLLEVSRTDGLPKRICSDCAAKLTIAYQFKKDAIESAKVLKSYSEMEKSENAIYDVPEHDEEESYDGEYDEIEGLDDESQDMKAPLYEEVYVTEGGITSGNDAVSFLTGILKPKSGESSKIIEFKKISKKVNDSGFEDPNRKHCCNVCNKKFQKRSNLIDHLRLHANVKVFSCDFCEKSFVQAGNYKAHIRTHTKEKPYSCHFCNKSYSQSSSLKIHIRSHTQEKNYLCEVCEKAFTNASDLGKHKMIHDPVKKFKCEECDRHFTQKIHLRKHLEKHHPEIDFDEAMKEATGSVIKVETVRDDEKISFEEYELVDEDHEMESKDEDEK